MGLPTALKDDGLYWQAMQRGPNTSI